MHFFPFLKWKLSLRNVVIIASTSNRVKLYSTVKFTSLIHSNNCYIVFLVSFSVMSTLVLISCLHLCFMDYLVKSWFVIHVSYTTCYFMKKYKYTMCVYESKCCNHLLTCFKLIMKSWEKLIFLLLLKLKHLFSYMIHRKTKILPQVSFKKM